MFNVDHPAILIVLIVVVVVGVWAYGHWHGRPPADPL